MSTALAHHPAVWPHGLAETRPAARCPVDFLGPRPKPSGIDRLDDMPPGTSELSGIQQLLAADAAALAALNKGSERDAHRGLLIWADAETLTEYLVQVCGPDPADGWVVDYILPAARQLLWECCLFAEAAARTFGILDRGERLTDLSACVLASWVRHGRAATNPAAGSTAAPATGNGAGLPTAHGRRKDINARMITVLADNPLAVGWTLREWAARLSCSTSSIHRTQAWENLETARKLREAERVRRKGKPGRGGSDANED